jgi:glyoxalase family protein
MTPTLPGIHHITAIAGVPQANLDFYAGLLGLRFVKQTVNFDDPGTYHFYYGDERGRPGTLLTFFLWGGTMSGVPGGRGPTDRGAGQAVEVAFAVPMRSLGWWGEHLKRHRIIVEPPVERFAETALGLRDPDGLALALVADSAADALPGRERGPVPVAHAIRGFHGVTLCEADPERTAAFLASALGVHPVGEEGGRMRCESPLAGLGTRVDLVAAAAGGKRAAMGAGAIHHVAWRARDAAEQAALRESLLARGVSVTPVLDRRYFRSTYFREPGGVLFEIATDPPGFTVDERVEELGSGLRLPPWLEPQRGRIESMLPPVRVPEAAPR